MNAAPPRRPSGSDAEPGDDEPLSEGEAQLLGEVYATVHALMPRRRDDQELYELGRAVYAGAASAKAHLRRAGVGKLRDWLDRIVGEFRATAHFPEAVSARSLAQLFAAWDGAPTERRRRPR